METKNIYNLIILDESGSMSNIQKQAVSAINETVNGIRKAQEMNHDNNFYVSLVVFEGSGISGVRSVRDRVPVEKFKDIKQSEYCPGGCTPLYDAMGLSINNLSDNIKSDDNVLVTIITDGMENSSTEYSGKVIKEMVENKRKLGWTFAYIGANQDAVEVASDLSIKNALNFEASEDGVTEMGEILSDSTMKCFCQSVECSLDDSDNFFSTNKRRKR